MNKFDTLIKLLSDMDKWEVDPDQTTMTANKKFEDFKRLLSAANLEQLSALCDELRTYSMEGKIKFTNLADAEPMPEMISKSDPEESIEPPIEEPLPVPKEEVKEADPPQMEEPKTTETEDEYIPIDWIDKIPVDKYSIDPHGHVRNNYGNAHPVLPFMKNGQMCVKLTGVVKAGKKNPMTTTVPINSLLEIVFRKMQAAAARKKWDTEESAPVKRSTAPKPVRPGRYRIEDLSVPMKPLEPSPDDNSNKSGFPDFARIDFVPMIPADKYIIYQNGDVVNTRTKNKLTLKKDRRYCLIGDDGFRAYRLMTSLLIAAFSKDRPKAISILNHNQKPRLIDEKGPIHLNNIQMDYYK